MSYGISAVTNAGPLTLQTASVAEARVVLNQVRREGATDISLTRDGRAISEAELAKLTALVTAQGGITRYA